MKLKDITWDYQEPLDDALWRAQRIATFFPFLVSDLSQEDIRILLQHLDQLKVPEERKELIRMTVSEAANG